MRKVFILFLIVMFLFTSHAHVYGQIIHSLPDAQMILHTGKTFQWPTLVGMKVDPKNPLVFDFILNPGDLKEEDSLKKHSQNLIGYFLTSLTIPDSDLWVNLSPYEENRIVPYEFGLTHMGRDLLAQDYILKQIASSALYPKEKLGELFWQTAYQKIYEQYGTTDLPLDTFNKIWIIPDEAVVHELEENSLISYIQSAKLKVLLESDYIALEHASIENSSLPQNDVIDDVQKITQEVTREIIIPLLEKEVNEGEHFLQLRQVYHSLILASWYKQKIQNSLLSQSYVNQKKIAGVKIANPHEPKEIWNLYVQAFQQGVFQYIEEERDLFSDELIPRKYFAGGFNFSMSDVLKVVRDRFALWKNKFTDKFFLVKGGAQLDQQIPLLGMLPKPKEETVQERYEGLYIPNSVDDQKVQTLPKFFTLIQSLRRRIWVDQPTLSLKDVLQENLLTEKKLAYFIKLLSLMRVNYDYNLKNKDPISQSLPLGNLGYAVHTGHFLKIGENLYISPITGSFRRHFLFRTDQNNRIVEAVEVMIPGDQWGRDKSNAQHRKKVADHINGVFKNQNLSVDVLLTRIGVKYQARLYNLKYWLFNRIIKRGTTKEADITVFSYPFDGMRVTAINNKESISQEMGISLQEFDEKIVAGSSRAFLALRQLGYFGNMDMHAENFRLGLIYNKEGKVIDIIMQLVADYGSIQKRWKSKMWAGVFLAGTGLLYHLIPDVLKFLPQIADGHISPSAILLHPFFIYWWGLVAFGTESTDYMSLFVLTKKYSFYPNLSLSILKILKIYLQESFQIEKSRQFNSFIDTVISSVGGYASNIAGVGALLMLLSIRTTFFPLEFLWDNLKGYVSNVFHRKTLRSVINSIGLINAVHIINKRIESSVGDESSLYDLGNIDSAGLTVKKDQKENNLGGIDFNKEHLKLNTSAVSPSVFQDQDHLYLFQLLKDSEGLSPVVFNILPFQETDFFNTIH